MILIVSDIIIHNWRSDVRSAKRLRLRDSVKVLIVGTLIFADRRRFVFMIHQVEMLTGNFD